MNSLLDTHILLWVVFRDPRLDDVPWLDRYLPWGVSPIAVLEIALLVESGRFGADVPALRERLGSDERFVVYDVSSDTLVRNAIPLSWTRDPFDRLISAHSAVRRVPLCTLDRRIRKHHRYLPDEVRA